MGPALLPYAVLLDDARPKGRTFLFERPERWIEIHAPEDVPAALAAIDDAVRDGLWAAGAFAFELGYLLEPKLQAHFRPSPEPLIACGLYRDRQSIGGPLPESDQTDAPLTLEGPFALEFAEYAAAFARVRDYIAAGDVYQVNLTFPLAWTATGALPQILWRAGAQAGYGAVVSLADRVIRSFSPELFFAVDAGARIHTRPMKGTAPRGLDGTSDAAARAHLATDTKQRAENLMIVDLLRNDLSRVCKPGSVRVTDLFTVETYPTLHTMTSGIVGELMAGTQPSDLLRAFFPCGSVTGAPKVRAMEIIAETEPAPRGIYCGSIGYFGPGGEAQFNVAIRTLVHETTTGRLRMGVGGGIVYDSMAEAEYDEALLKARFVTAAAPFDLLETMRWETETGFFFLEAHLARLRRAALAFGIPLDETAIASALAEHAEQNSVAPRRVRLLVDPTGQARVESTILETPFAAAFTGDGRAPMRLIVSDGPLSSGDIFTRHKTTRRAIYDAALAQAKAAGADEAIILNEHGLVADGSYTTIFAARGGVLLTPRVEDGALDGVLKQHLAAQGTPPVQETSLTVGDLRQAEALYVGNSVRGLLRAVLV